MSASMTRWGRKTRGRGIWKQSNTITTTPRVKERNTPTTPMAPCISKSAYSSASGPMPMIGGSISGQNCSGLTGIVPPRERLRFRKKTSLARDLLAGLQQLLPAGFQVYVLFDSWYASNRLLKFCRRQGWHVICAIKYSQNRMLGDKKLSQWPHALRHQRYQRVQLSAADQRLGIHLVRTLRGKLPKLSFEVCVLISYRHHWQKRPVFSVYRSHVIGTANPADLSSVGPLKWITFMSNSTWAWLTFGCSRTKRQRSGLPLSSSLWCFCSGV